MIAIGTLCLVVEDEGGYGHKGLICEVIGPQHLSSRPQTRRRSNLRRVGLHRRPFDREPPGSWLAAEHELRPLFDPDNVDVFIEEAVTA